MSIPKENAEEVWISLILRLGIGLLFSVAALGKFVDFNTYANMVLGMFKDTPLPIWLLKPYVYVLPFAEALIPIWLFSGIKLKEGWIFTALVLITLSFGLTVARQSSADIFMFILCACVGLYMSKYDCCRIGKNCK